MKSFGTESDNLLGPDALAELHRLAGLQHYHKRRNTVLALVDARLAGQSEETVWRRSDTCSRNTWHMKWKHDAVMLDVLAKVERSVREWRDTEELRALRRAARELALASPEAAEQLARMAATGQVRRLTEQEDGTLLASYEDAGAGDVRLAAAAVLDRAGKETAQKNDVVTWTPDEWRRDAENRKGLAARTLAEFDEDDDE